MGGNIQRPFLVRVLILLCYFALHKLSLLFIGKHSEASHFPQFHLNLLSNHFITTFILSSFRVLRLGLL